MRTVLLATLCALAACSTHDTDQDIQSSTNDAMTGKRPLKMRNCPSAVPTATTRAVRTKDGVDVVVTSADPEAGRKIAELAQQQDDYSNPRWFVPQHSGLHGGPGTTGYCPIIHQGTIVTSKTLANGARIHVAARSPLQLVLLQHATEERVRALQAPSS